MGLGSNSLVLVKLLAQADISATSLLLAFIVVGFLLFVGGFVLVNIGVVRIGRQEDGLADVLRAQIADLQAQLLAARKENKEQYDLLVRTLTAGERNEAAAQSAVASGKMAVALLAGRRQQLAAALLSAFPTRAALARLLSEQMDENLDAISGDGDLTTTIANVLQWADSQGRMDELIAAAAAANPGNPALREFVAGR